MAFQEGTQIGSAGTGHTIVVLIETSPSSGQGATIGGHSVSMKSAANVNSGVTKVGAAVGRYSPDLAILLGTDDF